MRVNRDIIRQKLIDGTIHVISREGLDKATTKRISQQTELNEVYIYRQFEDKEDLFIQTFTSLDSELIDTVLESLPVMNMMQIPIEQRCRLFFTAVWKFMLGNAEKCLCYMQYYYSPYYFRYSMDRHRECFAPVLDKFKSAFKPDVDVWMMLSHILDIMLSSSKKVFDGLLEDSDNTTAYIFDLLYSSIQGKLAWSQSA